MSVLADNSKFKNNLFHVQYKVIEILFLLKITRENPLIFLHLSRNHSKNAPLTEFEFLVLLNANRFTLKFALENLVGYW